MVLTEYIQIYTLSIVFVGDFNPVIIQPFWLANKKLLREYEAETAKIELIHNELLKFELQSGIKIEVTKNRFEIKTSLESLFEPSRDLAISIFQILNETPITSLGINHLKYYAIPDEERYHQFGNNLGMVEKWKSLLNEPKLLDFNVVEQKRKDGLNGHYAIRIQPSDVKLSTSYGLLININDHYSINEGESSRKLKMISLLKDKWEQSFNRAKESIEFIESIT